MIKTCQIQNTLEVLYDRIHDKYYFIKEDYTNNRVLQTVFFFR